MNKIIEVILVISIVLFAGCGKQGRSPVLTVKIPYGGVIWPKGQIVDQYYVPGIPATPATGDSEVGMTTVGMNVSGDRDKIIKFYDKSYSGWESLSGWETREISVPFSRGGVWKGWKRDETYAIIAVSRTLKGKEFMILHYFGPKYHYDGLTKDWTNKSGLEQPATPTPSP